MDNIACAFTGHRPKSFPWKYDENARDCVLLKEVLAGQVMALADRGVTDWLSGMAQGTDLWCAQIVLGLKEKNPADETRFQKLASDASVNTLASCLLVAPSPNPVEQPHVGAGHASSGRLPLKNL